MIIRPLSMQNCFDKLQLSFRWKLPSTYSRSGQDHCVLSLYTVMYQSF